MNVVKYTYLLVNLCSIAVPLAFSFEGKLQFFRKWKALLPALLIPAVFFLVWDSIFTTQGVWGFNENYLTGIQLYNLPIEEVLFFFCIPYCCVFTYEVLNYFIKQDILGKYARYGTTILAYVLVALVFKYNDLAYTFYTSIFTFLFLLLHLVVLKKPYWSRLVFTFLIILMPFFIVNGILTGTGLEEPVVWYNDAENLGIRLLTIPIEDAIYGFLLIGLNITLYEWRKTKNE
ncbi:MAG: lycopene cyclase domain-containing protein [Flavobacteriales bacterium]|nr:lycopene cyclase domain-containing protein [Flavobacteriales bacterium]